MVVTAFAGFGRGSAGNAFSEVDAGADGNGMYGAEEVVMVVEVAKATLLSEAVITVAKKFLIIIDETVDVEF